MAIANTNISPILEEGTNITFIVTDQIIKINSSGGGGTPGGSDTQVQFNDSGSFGGDAGMTYNKTTNTLSVDDIDTPRVKLAYLRSLYNLIYR